MAYVSYADVVADHSADQRSGADAHVVDSKMGANLLVLLKSAMDSLRIFAENLFDTDTYG